MSALAVYGAQVDRIVRDGGKVRTAGLDLPELLMSVVFAGFFTMLTISAVMRHGDKEPKTNIDSVLPSSLIFVVFTAGIAGFIRYRGSRLRPTFGLDRVPIFAALGSACGLIAAAFPIAIAANALTPVALHRSPCP